MWSWRSLILLLSLQTLLLPVYGPWLDPLFAGRMPNHSHIYFGPITPHHHHTRPELNQHPPASPFTPYFPQGVTNLPTTQSINYGATPILPLDDLSQLLTVAHPPLSILWQAHFMGCNPFSPPQPDIPPRHR